MNTYPQRLHEQDVCDNRVQTQINECTRDSEMIQGQLNAENEKYQQSYKQLQKQLAEAKASLAQTIEQMTLLQAESKEIVATQEQTDKENQEKIKQLVSQEQ